MNSKKQIILAIFLLFFIPLIYAHPLLTTSAYFSSYTVVSNILEIEIETDISEISPEPSSESTSDESPEPSSDSTSEVVTEGQN